MTNGSNRLVSDVADYYSGKLAEYGPTPRGVDWNGDASQHLRFVQLYRLLEGETAYSVADFGCGYGALYDVLLKRGEAFQYTGIDASATMIEAARGRFGHHANARFQVSDRLDVEHDFAVASGIFNVKVGRTDADWRTYVMSTLDMLNRQTWHGFAFNCLTIHSDPDKMRPDLYYADPGELFRHCIQRYARNVALLHDYGLYEFTILVRKKA